MSVLYFHRTIKTVNPMLIKIAVEGSGTDVRVIGTLWPGWINVSPVKGKMMEGGDALLASKGWPFARRNVNEGLL